MASYKRATHNKAVELATEYYDNFLAKGAYPGELRSLPREREQAIDTLASQYLPIIRDVYGEDGWDAAQEEELRKFPVDKGVQWVNGVGPDPKTDFKNHKFSEFKKLVEHEGDGLGAWQGMSQKKLDKVMKDLRYNPYDRDSRNQFYKDLGEAQVSYDKGRAVDEALLPRIALAVSNPTAYGEVMEQALTDKPYDEGEVYRKIATDQAFNAVTAGATRIPAWWGMGLATAGSEAARQGYNVGVYGTDFEPSAVFSAPALALMAGRAPAMLSRGVGKRGSDKGFSAGFRKGAVGVDETETAKNALKSALIDAREIARRGTENDASAIALSQSQKNLGKSLGILGYGDQTLTEASNAAAVNAAAKRVQAGQPAGRDYTLRQMLGLDDGAKVTDRQVQRSIDRAWKEPLVFKEPVKPVYVKPQPQLEPQPEWKLVPGAPEELRFQPPTRETSDFYLRQPDGMMVPENLAANKVYFRNLYKADKAKRPEWENAAKEQYAKDLKQYEADMAAFNRKVADAQSDPYIGSKFRGETGTGNGVPYALGRELAITAPMAASISGLDVGAPISATIHGDVKALKKAGTEVADRYKESSWYRKLKKANPMAAAAFDAAMKEKEEEE